MPVDANERPPLRWAPRAAPSVYGPSKASLFSTESGVAYLRSAPRCLRKQTLCPAGQQGGTHAPEAPEAPEAPAPYSLLAIMPMMWRRTVSDWPGM